MHIGMSDEGTLRNPAKPEPRIEVEHTRIRKENNRLIWRIALAQDLFHQQPGQSAVSVAGTRGHCADLVAVARLTIDHVPHGLAANRADYLVVDDHRKDVISADPAAACAPIVKCATGLEVRCDEVKETIVPSGIGMAN